MDTQSGSVPQSSDRLAIAVGATNTVVHAAGRGIVLSEPSILAVKASRPLQVVAAGTDALSAVRSDPEAVIVHLRSTTIDFGLATALLEHAITRAREHADPPRVVLAIPPGLSPVDQQTLQHAAESAGSLQPVYFVEKPTAAALGAGVLTEAGELIVATLGGLRTAVAWIADGKIADLEVRMIGGNDATAAIQAHLRREHVVAIDEATAMRLKENLGDSTAHTSFNIGGRDLTTREPRTVNASLADIESAMEGVIEEISDVVVSLANRARPQLSQAAGRVFLTGGGALLHGLAAPLREAGLDPVVATNPGHAVVLGAATALQSLR